MQEISNKGEPAKKKLQKKVKRPKAAKKGGYPYGTKKGHGGLSGGWYGGVGIGSGSDGGTSGGGSDGGGGMGESLIHEMRFSMAPENKERLPNEEQPEATPDEEPNLSIGSDMDSESDMSDPDKQGLLRRVDGAHLVYKRQTENGTFEELWIFEAGEKMDGELQTKQSILAGTDIDPQTGSSESGEQQYELWTAGNAQIMRVHGLPN